MCPIEPQGDDDPNSISLTCCCPSDHLKKQEHITPLVSLHWLPVKERIKFKILVLVFKAQNNVAPLYLTELLSSHTALRPLRTVSTKSLC